MVVYVILGAIGPAGTSKALPRVLRPLQDGSPFRWASKALLAAEFRGRAFDQQFKLSSLNGLNPLRLMSRAVQWARTKLQQIGKSDADEKTATAFWLPHTKVRGKPKREVAGDYALRALGVSDATLGGGVMMLARLILAHSALALLGLVLHRPHAGD
jgi:hypothetical protein